MNILVLGSGGREHTLAWKIKQSPKCEDLLVGPGNSGTAQIAQNIKVNLNNFEQILSVINRHKIHMVVVGPEDPLVNGITDFLNEKAPNVMVIGPTAAAAQLEGSKEFAKEFMQRHQIPTAAYKSFDARAIKDAKMFLRELNPPYVLKADGLAAGKGVVILEDIEQAEKELEEMLLNAKFGDASAKVVIEEFLDGIELSCFVLTDGENYKMLPTAKDYKRIGEGDTGLNTGGMGAISPVPFADDVFLNMIEKQVVIPTIEGLKADNLPYKGFIFIGLIKVNGEPKVIEYNVRMGDPETEVVIPRLKNDIVDIFISIAQKTLNNVSLEIDDRAAATVMLVSGGYPETYEKGKVIEGLNEIKDSILFHAGAVEKEGKIVTSGGRVLAVTSLGENYIEALTTSYNNVKKIHFEGMYYRKDLGFDL